MFGIKTIAGLPVHVLMVHFAVVLVPLAAVALLATSWRADWRGVYALPVALLAVGGAVAAFISAQSGGALRRSLRESALETGRRANFGSHPGYGNFAEVTAGLLAIEALAVWAMERWGDRLQLRQPLASAVRVVAPALAVVAIVTMVLAGHSGATLVWKDLGNYVTQK